MSKDSTFKFHLDKKYKTCMCAFKYSLPSLHQYTPHVKYAEFDKNVCILPNF